MLLLKIQQEDIKDFMKILLKDDIFDRFEIRGVELLTFTKFEISCILNKETLDTERNYCNWNELREYIFNLIKGKRKPQSLKIIFSIPENEAPKLHENLSSAYLNMVFEEDNVNFITGTSQKEFSLDKSADLAWEDYVKDFFHNNKIPVLINSPIVGC